MRGLTRLLAFTLAGGAMAALAAGCTPTPPTIVLDPGHSGTSLRITDPATRLTDFDYPNVPEIDEAWRVTIAVRDRLVRDGYRVVLTKDSARATVSLRRRAEIANAAHAALAISIHDDHSQSWSTWGGQVYPQRVGQYRINQSGQKIVFRNAGVAAASQSAAGLVAAARGAAEGHRVTVTSVSFTGRPPLAAGNIPLVELFATVPWVYDEVGANPANPAAALSADQLNRYAAGLATGIEKAVPRS